MKKLLLILGIALLATGCNTFTPNKTTAEQPQSTQTNEPQAKTYSLAEVQAANSQAKCWTIIRGNVYDLTAWIGKHPGGEKAILGLCGKDGTQAFEKQHGGMEKQENLLKTFQIGILK